MEKLRFDNGVKAFQLGSCGVLRFNPTDPNLYARFMEAGEKLQKLEKELSAQAAQLPDGSDGRTAVALLQQADKQVKQLLNWVFGGGNDFEEILEGVNLLAVAGNGERVADNLIAVLQPVLAKGAERCAREKTDAALAQAKARREAL